MASVKKPKATVKKPAKHEDVDYEKLGRVLANVYETGYLDANRAYRMSFIKGMLGGFGGVLGATVLIALLLWFLSFFNEVPFIQKVTHAIVQSQSK